VSTQENPTNTIVPAGSIVAANDPPAAVKPDCITFLKELEALHNELFIHLTDASRELDTLTNKMTPMFLHRTFLPCTTEATHTQTTVATNDDRDRAVPITAAPNNIETHHN